MLSTALSNHPQMLLQWGAALGASLAAAVWDLRTRRIPNALTVTVLLAGLLGATWRAGAAGLIDAVGGAALLGLPFLVLFAVGGGGGGDAKLMAALGTWLGVDNGVMVLVAVTLTGAVLSILYAVARKRLRSVWLNLRRFAWSGVLLGMGRGTDALPLPAREELLAAPYGVSIFFGLAIAAGVRLLCFR